MAGFATHKQFTPREVITVAAIFAILTAAALAMAQTYADTLFFTVLYTVRATMILFTVSMCLYVWPGESERRYRFWLLFWTAGFISYAIHVYYSFFGFFGGSMTRFYASQGVAVATLNLAISAWWLLDILLAWFSRADSRWIGRQRTAIQVLIWLTFFASTVLLHAVDNKQLMVIILGILQTVAILSCLTIRLLRSRRKPVETNVK